LANHPNDQAPRDQASRVGHTTPRGFRSQRADELFVVGDVVAFEGNRARCAVELGRLVVAAESTID